MSPATGTGLGIPRLQELQFLETGMQSVVEGRTYDQIRRDLIGHMAYLRRDKELTGNHAGKKTGAAAADAGRYFHNANECLTELMRLGWVDQIALPSRKSLDKYRDTTFTATPEGAAWAAQLADNWQAAYDELLHGLWRIHPQLAGFVRIIARGRLRVPLAGWMEVHGDFVPDSDASRTAARNAFIDFLADRCAGAVEAGVTGWNAERDEIRAAVGAYIEKLTGRAARRNKDPFARNRDFVQACEEAVVAFAFERAGCRMDYITVEILRRWMRTLNVASFSYHVPGPSALIFWPTAEIREDDGLPNIARRVGREYNAAVVEEMPRSFARASEQIGGSFVPIHVVRAAVCSRLGVPESVFDRTLTDVLLHRGEAAPFQVHLDPASFGALPPTERPFLFESRGRNRPFYVMSLINKPSERKTT